jgi:predicted SprT family Zn-dependent metalloprotease
MKRKPADKSEPVHRRKQSAPRNKSALNRTKQKLAAVTEREYSGLQHAYDFFNGELFHAKLPQLLVTLQRKAHSFGYFSPDSFQSRTGSSGTHELALNPNGFPGRSDEEILSTLVHEMTHHAQYIYGHPGRPGYHNKEFAEFMRAVGLQTSSTGYPGGKKTGQKMSHYILDGGPYQSAYRQLQAAGFVLNWESLGDTEGRKPPESKAKYTCPRCEFNAWAIPGGRLYCAREHDPVEMTCGSYDTKQSSVAA